MKEQLHIGNHLSSAGGYLAMGQEAAELKADVFAFFTRNPRGGKAKDIDPKDVEAFLAFSKKNHIGPLVAHAPYTMNPCAAKDNLRQFAREMMADDLRRMEVTPGNYYNFHPGSHVGQRFGDWPDFSGSAGNPGASRAEGSRRRLSRYLPYLGRRL